jgi:hypothetical protein
VKHFQSIGVASDIPTFFAGLLIVQLPPVYLTTVMQQLLIGFF